MNSLLAIGSVSFVAIAFAAAGCSVNTTGGTSDGGVLLGKLGGGVVGASGTASGSSGSGTGASGTASGTSGTATGAAGTSGGAAGMAGTASGLSGSSTSTGDGGICAADPGDNACLGCFKQDCCTQLTNCDNDPACTACFMGTTAATCLTTNANAAALYACQTGPCSAACASGATSGSSSGTTTGTADCAPAASDTTCQAAIKASCCEQLAACNADATCVNCVENGCTSEDSTTAAFVSCFCGQSSCAQASPGSCQ